MRINWIKYCSRGCDIALATKKKFVCTIKSLLHSSMKTYLFIYLFIYIIIIIFISPQTVRNTRAIGFNTCLGGFFPLQFCGLESLVIFFSFLSKKNFKFTPPKKENFPFFFNFFWFPQWENLKISCQKIEPIDSLLINERVFFFFFLIFPTHSKSLLVFYFQQNNFYFFGNFCFSPVSSTNFGIFWENFPNFLVTKNRIIKRGKKKKGTWSFIDESAFPFFPYSYTPMFLSWWMKTL